MKLLAAVSVLSSLAWFVLPDVLNNWPQSAADLFRLVPPIALMVIAFVTFYTASGPEQLLFPRVPLLWILFIALAAFHFYLSEWRGSVGELLYGAVLTGSVRFAIWLVPPLLLSSWVWYPRYRQQRSARAPNESPR